jgi:hypothetical protein
VTTGRRAVRCRVVTTCMPRGSAGVVCRCLSRGGCRGKGCSRGPPRGRPLAFACWLTRRVCSHGIVLVGVGVSSWAWWPDYRRRTRPLGAQAVFPGMTDRLRVIPCGRDISVDSLATQLVINRRLAHGRHRRGSSAGAASTWCVQVETLCGWAHAMAESDEATRAQPGVVAHQRGPNSQFRISLSPRGTGGPLLRYSVFTNGLSWPLLSTRGQVLPRAARLARPLTQPHTSPGPWEGHRGWWQYLAHFWDLVTDWPVVGCRVCSLSAVRYWASGCRYRWATWA